MRTKKRTLEQEDRIAFLIEKIEIDTRGHSKMIGVFCCNLDHLTEEDWTLLENFETNGLQMPRWVLYKKGDSFDYCKQCGKQVSFETNGLQMRTTSVCADPIT